jgi:RNA ligase
MKSRFENSATETDKYGRIFIKMGFAGFNSRANNLNGYTSRGCCSPLSIEVEGLNMDYEFPLITNISDVLPAVEGREEFVIANKGSYIVINYNMMLNDSFPAMTDDADLNLMSAIRRECRGIIFDSESGDIIRRPYHKFFNVGERQETSEENVNLEVFNHILEKIDGSMLAPFRVGEKVIWGTKMGETEVAAPVEKFVEENPRYDLFARWMISMGFTPIFEWCSRKQRIVLDYPEDSLILTAIRHMKDGHYVNFDSMNAWAADSNIPVVRSFDLQFDMKEFIKYTSDLIDTEGFVIRFHTGHMVKSKSDWYVAIHKAKEAILFDRNIVELILDEKIDDIIAHLPAADRDRLIEFDDLIIIAIRERIHNIKDIYSSIKHAGISRKDFALGMAKELDSYTRAIIFGAWDGKDINELVLGTIRDNLSKNVKYDELRDVWWPELKFNY